MFISRKWEYEPIRQIKLSVLLFILCKCNCRRHRSHCMSATHFAPQKCASLITEKFPNEEGGRWPTSVTHFAKVTYLRPPTRLFHSSTLRRLGLCSDRPKPPRCRDVEQSSPRPDWIQNRQAHPGGRSQKLPPEAEQTTRTPAFWGYPPPPHDYPYYWVILDPKSKEDKVKVTNLKNLPKQPLQATHLLKLLDKMCKYEMDLTSIVEDRERTRFCQQTDRRADGQGETRIAPFQLRWSGGYNKVITSLSISIHPYLFLDWSAVRVPFYWAGICGM